MMKNNFEVVSRRQFLKVAGCAAVAAATPLSKNAYKVPILEAVVRRTILSAARG